MLSYFSNVVCPFRANFLGDESIWLCLIYAFQIFKNHKERSCWCFSCRIYRLLSEVVVGRRRHSLILMKSGFKISKVYSQSIIKKRQAEVGKEKKNQKSKAKLMKNNALRIKHLTLKKKNAVKKALGGIDETIDVS